MIKAIETHWKGYRFRSRLEARWAVFFEEMGWNWKYEHQGYQIGWQDSTNWLPDFEVEIKSQFETYNLYVEVKGDPDFFKDAKFLNALDFCGGPPGHPDSFNDVLYCKRDFCLGSTKPILLLGDIPQEDTGVPFAPLITHGKGVNVVWAALLPSEIVTKDASLLFKASFGVNIFETCVECDGLADFQMKVAQTKLSIPRVKVALRAAKSARFEHGEKPRVLS